MKMITSFTLNWDLEVIEEHSEPYHGTVSECKGGGSSYYGDLDRLYRIQADQAETLGNVAKTTVLPAYQGYMQEAQNYGSQANQEQQATQAGADAQAAAGSSRAGMESDMASMGINPADSRYQGALSKMATDQSAQQAAGMSGARDQTRRMGMAYTQDAVSLGMGTPTQAASAAAGATNAASSGANLYQQNRARDAQGIGSAVRGGMDLYGYLNTPAGAADGGYVHMADGGYVSHHTIQKMAGGGILKMKMDPNATPPPPPGNEQPNPYLQNAGTAAKGVGIAKKAYNAYKPGPGTSSELTPQNAQVGQPDAQMEMGPNYQMEAQQQIDSVMPKVQGLDAAPTEAPATAPVAADTAGTVGEGAVGGAATEGATDAAATAAVTGATEAATEEGAAEIAADILAEYGSAALVAAANGGQIGQPRQGIGPGSVNSKGGPAHGPGGPKSDKIPVMLSDGEFVLPVGTVKKYGLAKLEKMRQEGLQFEQELGIRKPQAQGAQQ